MLIKGGFVTVITLVMSVNYIYSQAFTIDNSFVPKFNFFEGQTCGEIRDLVHMRGDTLLISRNYTYLGLYNSTNVTLINDKGDSLSEPAGFFQYFNSNSLFMPNLRTNGKFVILFDIASMKRFGLDAKIDTEFDSIEWNKPYKVNYLDINVQKDGSFFVFGDIRGPGIYDPYLVRNQGIGKFSSSYILDTTWRHAVSVRSRFFENYSDDRMLVWGNQMYHYDHYFTEGTGIVRIFKESGTVDSSFMFPVNIQSVIGLKLKTLKSGKILAYGEFEFLSPNREKYFLLRLNSDGSIDPQFHKLTNLSFTNNEEESPILLDVEEMGSGRILVVGRFDTIQGYARNCIALLDSSGHLVANYFTGSGAQGADFFLVRHTVAEISAIVPTAKNRFYLMGQFKTYDGLDLKAPIVRIFGEDWASAINSEEINPFSSILMYPNPAHKTLHLDNLPSQISLRVYSSQGILVFSSNPNEKAMDLDVSDYPSGVYFIRIKNDVSTYTSSVIIIQ